MTIHLHLQGDHNPANDFDAKRIEELTQGMFPADLLAIVEAAVKAKKDEK